MKKFRQITTFLFQYMSEWKKYAYWLSEVVHMIRINDLDKKSMQFYSNV